MNRENYIKAKLHDLYSLFNITGMGKSLMMKWVGHKAYTVKKRQIKTSFSHFRHKTSNKKDHYKNFRCKQDRSKLTGIRFS